MKKIILIILLFAYNTLAIATTGEVKVSVKGMVCGFCAQGIQKKFSQEDAINSVKVSLSSHLVDLKLKDGKDIPDEKITAILKDAGYTVEKIERL
jgi:copper chaperone CopZ